MCTEFHRSAYKIMQLFDENHPKSARDIYDSLRARDVVILLGATNSVSEFLESLCAGRELEEKEGGYVLTRVGVRERERLARIVSSSEESVGGLQFG